MVEHGTVTFHSTKSGLKVKLPLFCIAAAYSLTSDLMIPAVVPTSPLSEVLFSIADENLEDE